MKPSQALIYICHQCCHVPPWAFHCKHTFPEVQSWNQLLFPLYKVPTAFCLSPRHIIQVKPCYHLSQLNVFIYRTRTQVCQGQTLLFPLNYTAWQSGLILGNRKQRMVSCSNNTTNMTANSDALPVTYTQLYGPQILSVSSFSIPTTALDHSLYLPSFHSVL